jgi:hypothetical protein
MMKYFLILLTFASALFFPSCVKTVDVFHDVHDTLFLSRLQTDTFRTVTVHSDTVVKQDNHADTVIQVRHDTLIITKTITDTLFQRDTVLQTHTIVEVDTVYSMGYSLGLNYAVPATDSGRIYIVWDTVPGLVINNIEITNLGSYIPGSGQFPGQYSQVCNYKPTYYTNYGWMIHPVGPMICNIVINYTWTVPYFPNFTFQTFDHTHSWSVQTTDKLGGADGTQFTSRAVFSYIDLTQIFFIQIRNHN